MRPSHTAYRLKEETDEAAVDSLWASTDIPKFPTSFPEIVADRSGKIIGFTAIRYDEQGLLVEPMIAPNMLVYLRLVEAMDNVLRNMGMRFYHFRLEPHRVPYIELLQSRAAPFGVKELGYHKGFYWFRRDL